MPTDDLIIELRKILHILDPLRFCDHIDRLQGRCRHLGQCCKCLLLTCHIRAGDGEQLTLCDPFQDLLQGVFYIVIWSRKQGSYSRQLHIDTGRFFDLCDVAAVSEVIKIRGAGAVIVHDHAISTQGAQQHLLTVHGHTAELRAVTILIQLADTRGIRANKEFLTDLFDPGSSGGDQIVFREMPVKRKTASIFKHALISDREVCKILLRSDRILELCFEVLKAIVNNSCAQRSHLFQFSEKPPGSQAVSLFQDRTAYFTEYRYKMPPSDMRYPGWFLSEYDDTH